MSRRHISWIGLLVYAASFFLVAAKFSDFLGVSLRGYECASDALVSPWDPNGNFDGRLDFLSTLISGWINPVFLVTAIFIFLGRWPRTIAVLRIVVICMIPFCWVVFHYEGLYPREGHFVWVLGMLLTLFSRRLAKSESRNSPA